LRRVALALAAAGLLAAAAFAVPTIWFKPWFIEHLYARVFIRFALEEPMLLSTLRVIEPWGLRFHEDELGDFSNDFQRRRLEWVRRELEILRSYDRERQTPSQRLSTDVLAWFLEDQVRGEPFLFYGHPFNQFQGVQDSLPDFMINVHPLHDATAARDYVARLRAFGPALDQVIAGVRERNAAGVVPPRFVVDRVREALAERLSTPPEQQDLYIHFAEAVADVDGLGASQRTRLVEDVRRALSEVVLPAWQRVDGLLADQEALARSDAGVWSLPDGDAYYAWALRHHTTTDLSPDAVHALGLREVERLGAEIGAILESEGLPADDPAAGLAALERAPRSLFPDSDAGRQALLAEFGRILDAVRPRLPGLFGRLPRAPVEVQRVPEFKQAGSASAYYFPPALDGSRPGVFYANLRSVEEHPRFGMHTLAFHEALPGHHLQIALSQELEDVPFFRRVVPFTAFVEGWALYAERLAAEQGLFPTPLDHLGQLQAELFRAVRLVVDTGIHAKRWSRERAIEYMARHTGMAETEVVAEIERYIVWPGQACAYKVGQLKFLELRERARAALGDRFDLRDFHDTVLRGGALPLTVLERVVEDWVEARLVP
jgi:uncharacterized protein (DUF885 family)